MINFGPLKSQKAPRKLKNRIFGQTSNSSLIFDPLPRPILELSSKFNYTLYLVIIQGGLAKISFSELIMPIHSYGGKLWKGSRLNPPGIKRVDSCGAVYDASFYFKEN